jgi:MurNAc alpha-1-phosphate uridylyltransferase
MLFAAGLGTRMQPLTAAVPKPLVEIGGRALLDYNLAHFIDFGCERIVINTHYLADQIAAHVARLGAEAKTEFRISHEIELLETGGGIVKALPLLGSDPFFSANSDSFWIDGPTPALARMSNSFDAARMDALLLLVPRARAFGYQGAGDFDLHADTGELTRHGTRPYVFTGLHVFHPQLFAGRAATPFSLRELYRSAEGRDGRLARFYGLVHDADWVHVGTPEELAAAERYLVSLAREPACDPVSLAREPACVDTPSKRAGDSER